MSFCWPKFSNGGKTMPSPHNRVMVFGLISICLILLRKDTRLDVSDGKNVVCFCISARSESLIGIVYSKNKKMSFTLIDVIPNMHFLFSSLVMTGSCSKLSSFKKRMQNHSKGIMKVVYMTCTIYFKT